MHLILLAPVMGNSWRGSMYPTTAVAHCPVRLGTWGSSQLHMSLHSLFTALPGAGEQEPSRVSTESRRRVSPLLPPGPGCVCQLLLLGTGSGGGEVIT